MPRIATFVTGIALAGCGLALDLDPPDPRGEIGMDAGPGRDAGGLPDTGAATDAAPGTDARTPDAGPPPVPSCGGPSALQDTFEGEAHSAWADPMSEGSGSTFVRDGRVLMIDVGAEAPQGGFYRSRETFDARDDLLAVQVGRTSPGSPVETFFSLTFAGVYRLGFVLAANELRAIVETEDTLVAEPVPWDPVAHRWWRLGGRGGIAVAETSPDGIAWRPILPPVPAAFLEGVQVELGGRRRLAGGDTAQMTFEDLGLEPAPTPDPQCPIHAFTDSFEIGPSPYRWLDVAAGEAPCVRSSTPGTTTFSTTDGTCGIESRHRYDATSDVAAFHWGTRPATPTAEWGVTFEVGGGSLLLAKCLGEAATFSTPIDRVEFICPEAPRWRFRHVAGGPTGGEMIWEVSDDGTVWREATVPLAAPARAPDARVRIGLTEHGGVSASLEVLGYNTP